MSEVATLDTNLSRTEHHPLEVRLKLKKDYIQGKGTLAALCAKHGVLHATFKDYAADEKWVQQRQEWFERASRAILPPEQATEQAPPEKPKASESHTKLGQVESQLETLDRMINDCNDVKTLESLWRSKEKALAAWARLTGFPREGVRKQTRQRHTIADIQPIPADPQPVYPTPSVQPAKPMGWEYD